MEINKYNKPLRNVFSGIHIKPFFKYNDISSIIDSLNKGIAEIEIPIFIIKSELLEQYPDLFSKSTFENNNNWLDTLNDEQLDTYCDVKSQLEEDALMLTTVYQARNYDAELAYFCGLIPFKVLGDYEDIEFLALGGCDMDLTYKLEAYQLLADASYDEKSYFAEKGIVYFENYYGEKSPVVVEIKKLLISELGLS